MSSSIRHIKRYAIVEIEYEVDTRRELQEVEHEATAIGLALHPNYNTVENGVKLKAAKFLRFTN